MSKPDAARILADAPATLARLRRRTTRAANREGPTPGPDEFGDLGPIFVALDVLADDAKALRHEMAAVVAARRAEGEDVISYQDMATPFGQSKQYASQWGRGHVREEQA